jgi:hypothetical protein
LYLSNFNIIFSKIKEKTFLLKYIDFISNMRIGDLAQSPSWNKIK